MQKCWMFVFCMAIFASGRAADLRGKPTDGIERGNGGDFVRLNFLKSGNQLLDRLAGPGFKSERLKYAVDTKDLRAHLTTKFIQVVDHELIDNTGSLVDALSSENGIILNSERWSQRWSSPQDAALIDRMVLHELLRSVAIDDDDYRVSNPLADLLANPRVISVSCKSFLAVDPTNFIDTELQISADGSPIDGGLVQSSNVIAGDAQQSDPGDLPRLTFSGGEFDLEKELLNPVQIVFDTPDNVYSPLVEIKGAGERQRYAQAASNLMTRSLALDLDEILDSDSQTLSFQVPHLEISQAASAANLKPMAGTIECRVSHSNR